MLQSSSTEAWKLAANQHGVVARRQLLVAGFTSDEIQRRISKGRLHPVWRGVYAIGRPRLTQRGWWMAAVLGCGADAVLSHSAAAALWAIKAQRAAGPDRRLASLIEVSVPTEARRRRKGIRLHRRLLSPEDLTRRDGIPVTTPARTLIDLATVLQPDRLEAAVNEADKMGLIDPETLRQAVDERSGLDGVPRLRKVLDDRTFVLTDSELERRFLRLVRRAGLPRPRTRQRVNGFRVDFYWPELRLVVETDGLRYHRTATQQSRDRIRDQAHTAAGFIALRFTHAQVTVEPERVSSTLRSVAKRHWPSLF
jgi:very-short-patch-repair endonuclease